MSTKHITEGARVRWLKGEGGFFYIVEMKDGRVTFARNKGVRGHWWLPIDVVRAEFETAPSRPRGRPKKA